MARGRGRGGGGRGGRGHYNNRNRGGSGGRDRNNGSWDRQPASQIPRNNASLEEYLEGLSLVGEEEKQAFWDAMRSDLPNSFRFVGSKGHAQAVRQSLINYHIPRISDSTFNGQPVEPPTVVGWYPDDLAWQMTTPKNVIRKQPQFAAFQKFLVDESSAGNITRQELVSMIPPLAMDVQPHHSVLDMCAAPGSKSGQIIEALHAGEEARVKKVLDGVAQQAGRELSPDGLEVQASRDAMEDVAGHTDAGRTQGILVANDENYKRAQMLTHQIKRLNLANVLVTNHDASVFPSIKIPGSRNVYLKFDRILADVPCSGDGTFRKNLNLWKDWTPNSAIGLHALQIRILIRAIQALKVGGRIVYSTCSMNPIEDEAVLVEAITAVGGMEKVDLVDMSDFLPYLSRREGLRSWRVMDARRRWWSSYDEVQRAIQAGATGLEKLQPSMFPSEAAQHVPLERCMRIYPHLQDTGGFFITVLEKKKDIKVAQKTKSNETPAPLHPKTDQPAPDAPVTQVVKEIESSDSSAGPHLQSLDEMAPGTATGPPQLVETNLPAAARQTLDPVPSSKRTLELEDDNPSKRQKSETSEPPARREHWPPPPAAHLGDGAHKQDDANETPDPVPAKRSSHSTEEHFVYLPPDHPELQDIYAFYNLHPSFPRDRFMVRNASGDPVKSIYYTSASVRDVLVQNKSTGIKFVHSGVRMFVKQDVAGRHEICKWRLQTEGLAIVEGWIGENRILRLRDPKILQKLLKNLFPLISGNAWQEFGELGETLREFPLGCAVLRCEPPADSSLLGTNKPGDPVVFDERMVFPVWRGMSSVNLMLPKQERTAMLRRLFHDDEELIDHSGTAKGQAKVKEAKDVTGESGAGKASGKVAYDARQSRTRNSSSEPESEDEQEGAGASKFEVGGQELEAAGEDTRITGYETHVTGQEQNVVDQSVESAPGVGDEDDKFNKTV